MSFCAVLNVEERLFERDVVVNQNRVVALRPIGKGECITASYIDYGFQSYEACRKELQSDYRFDPGEVSQRVTAMIEGFEVVRREHLKDCDLVFDENCNLVER